MYRLNRALGATTGLGITLKVMAGDVVNILGKSYWQDVNTAIDNGHTFDNAAITGLLNIFTSSNAVTSGLHGGTSVTGSILANNNATTAGGLTNFLNPTVPPLTNQPKANINWVLFDEHFTFVAGSAAPVDAGNILKNYALTANVTKNGYLYVYCSNQSNKDVFFDNLQLVHNKSALLEETHYYPFGLVMAGISSKSAGSLVNKYKFGGKELSSNDFSDCSGLELYDFHARNYDPQIGRFWGGDKKADKLVSWSPYTYCLNNPLVFVDPNGEYPIYVVTRSYAPFATFGPSFARFQGDNRGHTIDKGASYRTAVSINYDTETKTHSATGGHSQSRSVDGSKSAISGTTVKDRSEGDKIDVHSYGNNAAQPGSWDIDQFTKLDVKIEGNVKKDHILNVSGTVSGDDFPNQESMIYDTKGNTL